MKHVITYPGFAEGLNARGLYPEIEAAYSSEYTFHMLPFYEELPSGDRIIHSVSEHRDRVQQYMDTLEGDITILGKCGGSRVVASLDDAHVARAGRIALFNPPWSTNRAGLEKRFSGWSGSEQPDGSWIIPRGDNKKYIVTDEYMNSVEEASAIGSYQRLASHPTTKFFIVRGMDDEVIPPINVNKIEGVTPIDISGGNHHLTGESRQLVIRALAKYAVL